jgi:hypothetical protein
MRLMPNPGDDDRVDGATHRAIDLPFVPPGVRCELGLAAIRGIPLSTR